MYCYCGSIRWLFSKWLFKADWFWFWTSARNFCLREACVFGCILIFNNSFGLDPCLWLLWRSCYLGAFACMYNGPLKVKFYSVPSRCMSSSLTTLLLIPYPRHFSFMYRIKDVLCFWEDMGWYFWLGCLCWCFWPVFLCWYCCIGVIWWYCWLAFLLVCWCWFGPFWWCNVFQTFLLTIVSNIYWYGFMSMLEVSRV